jgi:hypothetical protein
MIKHLLFDLVLLLTILICPWWLSVFLALVTLYYLNSFYEMILFGLLLDIFYSQFSFSFNPSDYKFTFLFLFLFLSSFYIKKRLKFYNK